MYLSNSLLEAQYDVFGVLVHWIGGLAILRRGKENKCMYRVSYEELYSKAAMS